jgi:bacterioferritin
MENTALDTSKIIEALVVSYWMELETIQNYLAISINLEGVRGMEIKEALAEDITSELEHAREVASRIHILNGIVPGSFQFRAHQNYLQPPQDPTDVVTVIKGVIQAEEAAIIQYKSIIDIADELDDYVTEDICVKLLGEEEKHKREFLGFLKEYEV